MTLPAVSVVLADDHPALRAGIRAMLEASGGIKVVGEAGTGADTLRLVRECAPDVLVLDMDLPDTSGADVAAALAAEGHPTRVLAFSAYDDYAYVVRLLQAGAAGYITKDKPLPLLTEAVSAVARGEGRWFVSVSSEPESPLTEREREVLRCMANGLSNEAISARLHLSPYTVRNYTSSIYAKLGVDSWREAVAWAWQTGLAAGWGDANT